ncbi:Zinc finger protein 583 [Eumeta japonica]|uniref:Zinc finger protein 583 n=1 Tax=Eumeta variegata TaxID=151549 RepID=A0A4C1W8A2_EUMVA|nr:Zinc finger protein 583 [Eumeta japonica]
MSAEAALLPCPICSHAVFDSAEVLRERLINVSTNKILCPVCQEEVVGLDKLTIHLFSHINIPSNKVNTTNAINREGKCKTKADNSNATLTQTKKCRPIIAKNKTMNVAAANAPVKFVKIYPKLPVLSLNTLPVIEISRASPASAESQIVAINNACNVCGLQFLDANILRMHKWLIHNIDVNSNVSINRYPCHMCSKSFKMKGSLMVHLRVAHYGFSSNTGSTTVNESQVDVDAGQSQVNSDHHSCDKNDNKQWQCDVCKKCFTTKYFLKKHKRLHTG